MSDTDAKTVEKLHDKLKKAEAAAAKKQSADAETIKDLQGRLKDIEEHWNSQASDLRKVMADRDDLSSSYAKLAEKLETVESAGDLSEELHSVTVAAKGLEVINIELGEEAEIRNTRIVELEDKVTELGGHITTDDEHGAKLDHLEACTEAQQKAKATDEKARKALHKFDQEASKDTGEVPPSIADGDRRRKMVRELNEAGERLVRAKREGNLARNALNPDAAA